MRAPVFTSPALLCTDVELGDELFALGMFSVKGR